MAPAVPIPREAAPVGPANGGAAPVGPANGGAAPVGPANGGAAPVGPANGEAAPAGPVPANGEAALVGPANGEAAPVGPANGEAAPVGPANGEAAPVGPANGEAAPVGPANGEVAPVGPANGEAAPADPDPDPANAGQVPDEQQEQRKSFIKRLIITLLYNLMIPLAARLALFCVLQKVTSCEYPMVALNNRYGSMAPTLNGGDMLFMTNYPDDTINVGDIVGVMLPGLSYKDKEYKLRFRRVVKEHPTAKDFEGNPFYLTQVDNQLAEGTGDILGPAYVEKQLIVGKMIMSLPFLGIPHILLKAYIPHLVFAHVVVIAYAIVAMIYEMFEHRIAVD